MRRFPQNFTAVCFLILLVFTQSSGQITEEISTNELIENADSSVKCFPSCRQGFICHEGTCVSKCNPPCPEGYECGPDGECHVKAAAMRKQLEAIYDFKRAGSVDDVVQGFIIRTNRSETRIRLADTVFSFDKELFLTVPTGNYELYLDAPGRFTRRITQEIRSGMVDEQHYTLLPFKINAGISFGPGWLEKETVLCGNVSIGVNLFTRHYIGVTGDFLAPLFYDQEYLTDTLDYWYPDTLSESGQECYGLGLTYGFTGFRFIRDLLTIVPAVSAGYWVLDDVVYFSQRTIENRRYVYKDLSRLDVHRYTPYYLKPEIEIRIGNRFFGFRARAFALLGEGNPLFSANLGMLFAFP